MKKLAILIALFISLSSYSQTSTEYNQRGIDKFNKGLYEEAIKDYDKSIELGLDEVVYSNRAQAKYSLDRYEEAIRDCNLAISVNPKYARSYLFRGYAKDGLKQYEEAIIDYNKVIELDPKSKEAYCNRATAKGQLGQFEKSILDYNIAIELDDKYFEAYLYRAEVKDALKQYEEAIKDYNRVIELDPKSKDAYYNRAAAKVQLGQFEKSILDYNIAIELDDKYIDAYVCRGLAKSKMGNTEEAIKDIEQAIKLDPNNSYSYNCLGKCYLKANNKTKADECFNKVLSINDDPSLCCYAKVYLGQKEAGLSEMEAIVKKSKSSDDYYTLACINAIAGETYNSLINLDFALNKGFNDFIRMQHNEYFECLFYKPEYIALLKKYNITNINTAISISKIITSEVKLAMQKWQEKGEFETTAVYVERMKSRDNQVQKITQEVVSKMKNDYLPKVNWSNIQLGKYDPDGQSFLLNIEGMKGIVMNVPLVDAPAFKTNFKTYKIQKKDIVLSNDEWIVSELAFMDPAGVKKYRYDIKSQPDYNPNKIFTLNFAALDIKVNQYEGSRSSQKSVETQPIVVGLPEVDTNIPANKITNPHAYALIIGNEDYSSFQTDLCSEVNVAFAVNDAAIFKKYCSSTFGVPESNIKYLNNATAGQMSQAIAWINKLIMKEGGEAEVVVYYAGHGLPDEQTHEPYIIPVDVSGTNLQSAIKLQTLYTKLTEYPAKKVTVFMDACFSGGSRGQGLLATRGVKVKPKDDMLTGNIVVFTSSTGEQSSLPFKDKQHGMFTYYLLKKMQETKGNISYDELYNYVKKEVDLNCLKVNNKEQTPSLLLSIELGDKWKSWKFE